MGGRGAMHKYEIRPSVPHLDAALFVFDRILNTWSAAFRCCSSFSIEGLLKKRTRSDNKVTLKKFLEQAKSFFSEGKCSTCGRDDGSVAPV